jgi:hypothetical protein
MALAQALSATWRFTVEPHVFLSAMAAHTPCVHSRILDTHIHRCVAATGIIVANAAIPTSHEAIDVGVVQGFTESTLKP